jgi:murein DD-endopeptidase MepM/ murein hydrolase activator NlpD
LTGLVARAITWSLVALLATLVLGIRPAATRIVMEPRPGEILTTGRAPRLAPASVRAEWNTDTSVVAGSISSNLYAALDSCAGTLPEAMRAKLAWTMADAFEHRLDMSRDVQPGDSFRVLFERVHGPGGSMMLGRVLAAALQSSRDTVEAIRYDREGGPSTGDFYDPAGKALRSAFLRAPVEFGRISSEFGMRMHPILGIWRKHAGTDYAAPLGTPVRAVADGVIAFAGRRSGYGNFIEIRHANGLVTRYGHLRRFAADTRTGAHVAMGATIGYVGMTGLATAPHLHFEVLVNGVQRDPRVALRRRGGGEPIGPQDLAAFERQRAALLAALDDLHEAHGPAIRE